MLPSDVSIRRARRTDFSSVLALRASAGETVPETDRRTLRRFRQLVADLGSDLYVATTVDAIVAIVHVTYSRQLAAPPRAELAYLLVAPDRRRQNIGRALFEFVVRRARKRGCSELTLSFLDPTQPACVAFSEAVGFRSAGGSSVATLPSMD